MGSLIEILKNPDDLLPLVKLKMAAMRAKKKIPMEPHWCFCYSTLHRVSRSFALLIHQLGSELRDVVYIVQVCIYYLVLRALDTIEDDTSIALEVKLPILLEFHRRIYDRDWHFSCGTEAEKVLMDQFHNVSTAFLELERGYQEVIEDIAKRMGAGMAKFIAKDETETIEDYDEYCHYAAGLVGIGLSKFFHISGSENLAHDFLSNQMGLFLQKSSVLRDYLEDINEMPKPRKIWPRQVWSKYATELKDFKYGENSVKALQCLNEMVSISLSHVEDCFKYMSDLKDPAIFHLCAIPQILSIAMLTLCYNNIQVFRGGVKLNLGLTAKVFDRTRTMSDVYGAFFDFASILKSKVEMSDPSALITLSRLETIQKICRDSGTLSKRRKSYIIKSEPRYSSIMMAVLVITLAIAFVYLFANQSGSQMTFMRMMSITDY